MNTYSVKHILRLRLRTIEKLTGSFLEEDVHTFRVEVKRTRALVRLLSSSTSSQRRLPENLEAYYHMLGSLRTLQLQRKQLHFLSAPPLSTIPDFPSITPLAPARQVQNPALIFLDSQIDKVQEIIRFSLNRKNPFRQEFAAWIADLPDRISPSAVRRWLKTEIRSLPTVDTFDQWKADQFHECRKIFKDILYVRPWLKNSDLSLLPVSQPTEPVSLKSVTDLLGDYLDATLLLNLLGTPRFIDITDNATQSVLQLAYAKTLAERNSFRQQIAQGLGVHPFQPAPALPRRRAHPLGEPA